MSRRVGCARGSAVLAAAATALAALLGPAVPARAQSVPARAQVAPARTRSTPARARSAAAPDSADSRDHPPLFRASDLPYAGVVFGGVLLIEPLEGFERGVRSHTPSDPTGFDKTFVDAGDVAGSPYLDVGLALAAWGGGKLAGSPRIARAGLDAVETLVAADAVLLGGKILLGRRRPYATSDPDEFSPLAFHEVNQSYPSGHAARAFALAAVAVADFPDQRWVPWVAWPAAAATAASRVVGRDHWVTDVVGGAALGILSTRVILRLDARRGHDRSALERRAPSFALLPVPGGAAAVLDLPLP